MDGWGWKRAGGEGVSQTERLSEPTWGGGSSSPHTPRPPPRPNVVSDSRATMRPQHGHHGLVGQAQARDPSDSKRSKTRRPRAKPPVSVLSGPELGYKWHSQGDRIHTAGLWGAPVGAALSPTPCRASCTGEPEAGLSETPKGSPGAHSEGP